MKNITNISNIKDLLSISKRIKDNKDEKNINILINFLSLKIKEIKEKEGIDKLQYQDIIGKMTFFDINIKIYNMTKNENKIEAIVDKIIDSIENLNFLFENKSIKIKNNKDVLIDKENISAYIETKYGIYIIFLYNGFLRIFNLTSQKNGFHIWGNGTFCSGNTYETLLKILEKGKVEEFLLLLIKILTSYNDGAFHLAKPQDFERWGNIYKEKKINNKDFKNIETIIKKKKDFIENEMKLEGKTKEFFEHKIKETIDYLTIIKE